MSRLILISLGMIAFGGCTGPTFTDLGNGVGVPSASIDEYAAANGITHEEARSRLREETGRQRIAEHAEKYGISLEEAEKQLEHASR